MKILKDDTIHEPTKAGAIAERVPLDALLSQLASLETDHLAATSVASGERKLAGLAQIKNTRSTEQQTKQTIEKIKLLYKLIIKKVWTLKICENHQLPPIERIMQLKFWLVPDNFLSSCYHSALYGLRSTKTNENYLAQVLKRLFEGLHPSRRALFLKSVDDTHFQGDRDYRDLPYDAYYLCPLLEDLVDVNLWSQETRRKEEIEEVKSYEVRLKWITDKAERRMGLIQEIAPNQSDATEIIDYALSGKSCTFYQSVHYSANACEQVRHYYDRKVPMVRY